MTKPKAIFETAVQNIVEYGDTDIFPFPIENHILHDRKAAVVKQLQEAYSFFNDRFVQYPPFHIRALVPVGTMGFRWATQQDPFLERFFISIDACDFRADRKRPHTL